MFAVDEIQGGGSSGAAVSSSFTLKSGRVVRKISGAPQLHRRTWNVPATANEDKTSANLQIKTHLQGNPLIGEVIYTAKPVCHLAAMLCYGTTSWVPWLLSLSMDLSSLKLMEHGTFNGDEKKEINRRQLMLLMYLLRSPFYDRFSKQILSSVLMKLSKVPLVGVLPKHLLRYLPYWQGLYSYTWD